MADPLLPAGADEPCSTRPQASSSSRTNSNRAVPTYGYHNTFHTHARLPNDSPPPSYSCAISTSTSDRLNTQARREMAALNDPLPPYTCTVALEAILAIKQELPTPFQTAANSVWQDVFIKLEGTQLSLYRLRTPHFLSKNRTVCPGRLLRTFTMQHAEVGIASDFKKTPLIPRSPFAHLVPSSARHKLYESDPHLFEPVREHVIRVRLETEQFLVCCNSQEELLDWVESLCAAIDISPPLEDRSEPRYRSLPRRTRRQRVLDGSSIARNLEHLPEDDAGRRLIAEQERIIRRLYPHLAANASSEPSEHSPEQSAAEHPISGDPESDDLDPADARFPQFARPTSSGLNSADTTEANPQEQNTNPSDRPTTRRSASSSSVETSDPKNSPPLRHIPSQALRYRRRCAPVLLATSPRVSEVVFVDGQRKRINVKERGLVEFSLHPPRYDAHSFPKKAKVSSLPTEAAQANTAVPKVKLSKPETDRPALPSRGFSDDSIMSSLASEFGYDLASTSSSAHSHLHLDGDSDEARSFHPTSEPPSPTTTPEMGGGHPKAEARTQFANMGKTGSPDETPRTNGFTAVALGVGLLI